MELDKIIKNLHPDLKKAGLKIRLALAEEMIKDGWVLEGGSFTTPKLRFFASGYVAESRYRLTPMPGRERRERWKVESLDHPEWKRPHPHHYVSGGGYDGLCCNQVEYGNLQKEPLHEALAMAATMSGQVLEGCFVTSMRPFADTNLSTVATCPFCQLDVEKSQCQKNGYFYHPNCWKTLNEETR